MAHQEAAKRLPFTKFTTTLGEAYRVGNVVYLYLRQPVGPTTVLEQVRRHLEIPSTTRIYNRTTKMRAWSASYNLPMPADENGVYNYILTVGQDEPLPTIWPTHQYMQARKTYVHPDKIAQAMPTIVYPRGTATMCRFGHPKFATTKSPDKRGSTLSSTCHRCSWWRQCGLDLKSYKPTHCLQGHPLAGNRYLAVRASTVPGQPYKVLEHCVECHNQKIINKTGYKPHEG